MHVAGIVCLATNSTEMSLWKNALEGKHVEKGACLGTRIARESVYQFSVSDVFSLNPVEG